MAHLGVIVYCWGWDDQDRLLAGCLAPAAAELRRDGLARRFWFDRYDARGPHVFAIFTVPEEAVEVASQRLAQRLGDWLAEHPSTAQLSPEELAARHAGCRGRSQCAIDRLPGLAEDNTFHVFPHEPRGYPFWLSEGAPDEEEIWDLAGDRSLWAIGELGRPGSRVAAAVHWLATVDRALRRAGRPAGEYWRYHAGTLLLHLERRLAEGEDEILPALPGWIGTKNLEVFGRFWEGAARGEIHPRSARLVEIATSGGRPDRPWALLREIDHSLLKQLGLAVSLHIPLVLYAWHRNAPTAAVLSE